MSKLSVFLAIVIFLGGECFHGINAKEFTIETKNFSGMWYAVMATGCHFINNETPCECISAYFRALRENGWLVYMNAVNDQTHTLTVDVGGAAPLSDDKIIQGFLYSRAKMPLSVISASECSITKKVTGKPNFLRFNINIIGSSVQYNYMITKMSQIDKNNSTKGNLAVIWCHSKTPGKETIWNQIVKHSQSLKLDIEQLRFINQIGCQYPTENQYNEMFFC